MIAFTGAEALINSRPLTYQSANPEDDIPLKPNHLLCGQIGGQFAPEASGERTHQALLASLVTWWVPSVSPRQK